MQLNAFSGKFKSFLFKEWHLQNISTKISFCFNSNPEIEFNNVEYANICVIFVIWDVSNSENEENNYDGEFGQSEEKNNNFNNNNFNNNNNNYDNFNNGEFDIIEEDISNNNINNNNNFIF